MTAIIMLINRDNVISLPSQTTKLVEIKANEI